MYNVFVYGTLRVERGNYQRFNENFGMSIVRRNVRIPYHKLVVLGLPFVYYTGNIHDSVEGDILRVDEDCKNSIDAMEMGAGYNVKSINIEVDGETLRCTYYPYSREDLPSNVETVENGVFV